MTWSHHQLNGAVQAPLQIYTFIGCAGIRICFYCVVFHTSPQVQRITSSAHFVGVAQGAQKACYDTDASHIAIRTNRLFLHTS